MRHLLSPSQRAASALRRAEKALRDWQDEPDSPRKDVDRMLAEVNDLRLWVQGHVLADIDRAQLLLQEKARAESTAGINQNPSTAPADSHHPDAADLQSLP